MTVRIKPRDNDFTKNRLMRGGPGDKFVGKGKVNMSSWFKDVDILEDQIRSGELPFFCTAPFQMVYTTTRGEYAPCSWVKEGYNPNIKDVSIKDYFINVFNKFSFKHKSYVIFDQLNPSYSKYFEKNELIDVLKKTGFKKIKTNHRHGYSWTAIAEK